MRAPIEYTWESGVASIKLSSPESGNALAKALLTDLTQAIKRAEEEASCRAILLSASGPSFCQGADFASLFTRDGEPDPAYPRMVSGCLMQILRVRCPVIACVEGKVAGGGVGLTSVCDLVIAAPSATFQLPEAIVGMIPAVITPFLLRRLSPAAIRALSISVRGISGAEAQRLGLVDEIADEGLPRAVMSQLERLFRACPAAIAENKRHFNGLHEERLEEQIRLAEERLLSWLKQEDIAQGIKLFADGLTPPWFQRYTGQEYPCSQE